MTIYYQVIANGEPVGIKVQDKNSQSFRAYFSEVEKEHGSNCEICRIEIYTEVRGQDLKKELGE